MFRKIVPLLLLALAGCQSDGAGAPGVAAATPPKPPNKAIALSPKQVTAVQAGVRQGLKDPDSARFDRAFVAARQDATSVIVCGFVNARNSFGGYVGAQPFYGLLLERQGEPFIFTTIGLGSDDTNVQAVKMSCEQANAALPI